MDRDENVYVSTIIPCGAGCSTRSVIQKFTSTGTLLTHVDNGFLNPTGIAVDGQNNLYVVDTGNNRIQKLDSMGTFLTMWGSQGTGAGQFNEPLGIAVDINEYVFVADTGNSRIQKFTSTGTLLKTWGSYGSGYGQFHYPTGIAASHSRVYVSDALDHRIQKFDSYSGHVLFPELPPIGTGLAVDGVGNVYIAASTSDDIRMFTSTGIFRNLWGGPGAGEGQFNEPLGIAIGISHGIIYVADTGNSRIQTFTFCPVGLPVVPLV